MCGIPVINGASALSPPSPGSRMGLLQHTNEPAASLGSIQAGQGERGNPLGDTRFLTVINPSWLC